MEQIVAVYWIKILATLAVFGALIVLFVRQSRGKEAASGAGSVRSELEKLGDEYTVLDDVVVPAQHGMSRIDHVVVSAYGIFVITVNTVSGKLMGEATDHEWLHKSGRRRDTIYNPLWTNRKHLNAVDKRLGQVRLIPVVVLVHAKMKGVTEPNVVRLKGLINYIRKDKTKILTDEQRQEIVQKLTTH